MKLFQRSHSSVDWLIVCLGNPGEKYENTRHNVGFRVADRLGDRWDIPIQRLKYRALTGTCQVKGQKVMILKPTTFMNLSGESVHQAVSFFHIPPERVLVVCDDTSLPLGKLRVRPSGSAGGHNGLKNIIAHLGTDRFPRIKVGVGGKPHPDYDLADWVLGKFTAQEEQTLAPVIANAAEAVEFILAGNDISKAMNQYN